MKKDILIIFDVAFPFYKGGAQRRFFEVGRRLAKKGHTVSWLTFKHWEGDDLKRYEKIDYVSIGKAPEFYNKSGSRSKLEPIIFSLKILQNIKHIKQHRVIWIGQWPLIHIIPIVLVAKYFGHRILVDWWEVWGKIWIKYSKSVGWIGFIIERATLKLIMLLGGGLVTDSTLEKSRLVSILGGKSKIELIANGIPKEEIGSLESKPSYEFDVGNFGRLKNHKRVDLLLHSIAILKNEFGIVAKTAIIGDGPENQKLQTLSKKLGISEHVKFFGEIENQSECYDILKKCKLSVVTTISGGGGNLTLLECFGCGLPVIGFATKEGLDPELIENNKNGILVTQPNGHQLAKALFRVLSDNKFHKKLRDGAILKSKQHDWDTVASSYKTLLIE